MPLNDVQSKDVLHLHHVLVKQFLGEDAHVLDGKRVLSLICDFHFFVRDLAADDVQKGRHDSFTEPLATEISQMLIDKQDEKTSDAHELGGWFLLITSKFVLNQL